MEEEGNVEKVITQELEYESDETCDQINERLEEAENLNTLDESLLEESLLKFQECLKLDPHSIEARFGIVYVCGHLDRYDEGLAELATLEEMGVEDERIAEMKANLMSMKEEEKEEEHDTQQHEPLVSIDKLVKEGEITAEFQNVLTQIFNRFDKDKDGALSQHELDTFHRVVNGTPISPSTVKFLLDHFDVNHKGLTLTGFIGFYVSQTVGDAEETWKDLTKLGYDRQLTKTFLYSL